MEDVRYETPLGLPPHGDPEREAAILRMRAEIFGLNPSQESFPADQKKIRMKARFRRLLRRAKLAPRN